jgi:hypothetical protein
MGHLRPVTTVKNILVATDFSPAADAALTIRDGKTSISS